MDNIGAPGGSGRNPHPQQLKPASPEDGPKGDSNEFGIVRRIGEGARAWGERLRNARATGIIDPPASEKIHETAENRTTALYDRIEPLREKVGRAVARIEQRAGARVHRLEVALASGRIDPENLQARLTERFGDKADGLIGEDGALDSKRLQELFTRVGFRYLRERIDAFREDREPTPEPALDPDAVPEPGSVISIDA
ncbi:MAG: hypothetical protein O2912_02975 [Proteobacteria bacterium]|nr:hypothetical protein [Pseudomonadota bacterium]